MDDKNIFFAAMLYGMIATGTQLWGLVGWLGIMWVASMALDYATGTLAAIKAHDWSSATAREGLWHKGGMILNVLVAGAVDVGISIIAQSGVVKLPFDQSTMVSALVMSWYVLTELGSTLENSEKLTGKPIPWLSRFLRKAAQKAEAAGEQIAGGDDDG